MTHLLHETDKEAERLPDSSDYRYCEGCGKRSGRPVFFHTWAYCDMECLLMDHNYKLTDLNHDSHDPAY